MKRFTRARKFYVYIVQCQDGTYYTGYTPDIKRRIKLHNAGKGAKYTRDRKPVRLIWCKEYGYYKRAVSKEREIKKLTHKEKERLIRIYERSRETS